MGNPKVMHETLYGKLVNHNLIKMIDEDTALVAITRHLIHEVTSPIAFYEIKEAGGFVLNPERCLAVPDHNTPTAGNFEDITDPDSRIQIETLYGNTKEHGIEIFPLGHKRQGIVHIVGPEYGFTLPGTTVVCGDSHTATHGAFGALAWGIGTSEVRHALQTSSLKHKILKTRRINVDGDLAEGVESKDVILHIINLLGVGAGAGYAYEYAGSTIRNMSMEGRMTICNMSIEGGARVGLVGVDEKTLSYIIKTPRFAQLKESQREDSISFFREMVSNNDAVFNDEVFIDASDIKPRVTWGTTPAQSVVIEGGKIPFIKDFSTKEDQNATKLALDYMDLEEGQGIDEVPISRVFIGSCTNGRLSDLRKVVKILKGKKVAANIEVWVVPGSQIVTAQAEKEGILDVLKEAGCIVRNAGCSSCLAMNDDKIPKGQHCVSTSNRNFMNRQGPGARTHLVSPVVAAKTALKGYISN